MDPFVAEIRIFPFNFAPKGWAFCNGQILPISQNTALFSLLGTTYGGDGKSTFALPNMQGNAPMHPGQGQGLSLHDLGEVGGSQTVTLIQSEMAAHSHSLMAISAFNASDNSPQNNVLSKAGAAGAPLNAYVPGSPNPSPIVQMAPTAIALNGSSQPHNNMQPFLTLNFCIALQGVFPPRT
jgi:microcystin-dependent protein